jgi:hypothetical protein
MTGPRHLPAGNRPGRHAWLGPAALAMGLLSWLIPVAGAVIALAALVCGLVSMSTLTEYRIDWTAALGATVAAGQLLLSLVLVLA